MNYRTNDIPNLVFKEGMTLTVNPIINEKGKRVRRLKDGFTLVTKDGGLSAQWEHTIVVIEDGIEVMTDRDN